MMELNEEVHILVKMADSLKVFCTQSLSNFSPRKTCHGKDENKAFPSTMFGDLSFRALSCRGLRFRNPTFLESLTLCRHSALANNVELDKKN